MSVNAISVCASIRYMKENIYIFMIFSDHCNFCLILASDGIYSVATFETRSLWILEG